MLAGKFPDGLAAGFDLMFGPVGTAEEAHPGGAIVELMGCAGFVRRSDDALQLALVTIGIAFPGADPWAGNRIRLGLSLRLFPSAVKGRSAAGAEQQGHHCGQEPTADKTRGEKCRVWHGRGPNGQVKTKGEGRVCQSKFAKRMKKPT